MRVNRYLRDFFRWWWQGLLLALPERRLNWLRQQPDIVTVEQGSEPASLTFKHYTSAARQLVTERTMAIGNTSEQAQVRAWLGTLPASLELVVLLPQDSQLQKQISYPAAAEPELRSVLAFDMDKQTPFTADGVYFDYTITGRDTANEQIRITLCLIRREVLTQHLQALDFLGLQPVAARTIDEGAAGSINFLPPQRRASARPPLRSVAHLCLALLVVFIAALYLPLLRYDAVLEQSEQRVRQSREQAMQVQELESAQVALLGRINFLSELERQRPPFIGYLHELTRQLPDNSWLKRLSIEDSELHLQGESGAAASIIPMLEESDYFKEVRFRSPVTKNNATGKEQFHIVARLDNGVLR